MTKDDISPELDLRGDSPEVSDTALQRLNIVNYGPEIILSALIGGMGLTEAAIEEYIRPQPQDKSAELARQKVDTTIERIEKEFGQPAVAALKHNDSLADKRAAVRQAFEQQATIEPRELADA